VALQNELSELFIRPHHWHFLCMVVMWVDGWLIDWLFRCMDLSRLRMQRSWMTCRSHCLYWRNQEIRFISTPRC